MDGRAPHCASHQCPVANPNRVEDSRRGFAQSGDGRAFFVFQLLSPTCGVSYNKAHTLRIQFAKSLVQFPMRSPHALVHISYALRNSRITISQARSARKTRRAPPAIIVLRSPPWSSRFNRFAERGQWLECEAPQHTGGPRPHEPTRATPLAGNAKRVRPRHSNGLHAYRGYGSA